MPAEDRLYYMDWLRVLAMGFVFLVHTSMPFAAVDDPWLIRFEQTNMAFTMFAGFVYQFGMPLFFFLAGAATYLALAFRTNRQYLIQRIQRLLVPFVFGGLAFTALQQYISLMVRSESDESFLQFYPRLYGGCIQDPIGILRIDCFASHLWFLGFLFLYSILILPIIAWLRSQSGANLIARLAAFSQKPGTILLFFLPTAFIQTALRARYHGHTDWSDFFVWSYYFVFGYVCLSDRRFLQAITRHRYVALAGGLICTLAMGVLLLDFGYAEVWELNPVLSLGYALYEVLRSLNTWLWVVFLLGMGIRHLEFNHPVLGYSREALLPFYVLHQVVIVLLAFWIFNWSPPLLIKFVVLVGGAFLITVGLYELLVKRSNGLRFLFGMRLKS